jgi:hypothetical protein
MLTSIPRILMGALFHRECNNNVLASLPKIWNCHVEILRNNCLYTMTMPSNMMTTPKTTPTKNSLDFLP